MRIEFMPGMTNVVRFPLEVRVEPSLELLLDIAPDCREVDLVAEAFDLDRCLHEARGAADLAMAEHILNNVPPERGVRRRLALDGSSALDRASGGRMPSGAPRGRGRAARKSATGRGADRGRLLDRCLKEID